MLAEIASQGNIEPEQRSVRERSVIVVAGEEDGDTLEDEVALRRPNRSRKQIQRRALQSSDLEDNSE